MTGLPSWVTELTDVLPAGRTGPAGPGGARPAPATELRPGCPAVTLDVVHEWHLRTVVPLLTEATARSGRVTAACARLAAVHGRAREAVAVEEEEWFDVLEPVLRQVYRDAYGFQRAFAAAYENARSSADANGNHPARAPRYGPHHPEFNTPPPPPTAPAAHP
ncbi:SpcZ, partial [Streptomyces sp. NPDC059466]